jgi:phospholipase C
MTLPEQPAPPEVSRRDALRLGAFGAGVLAFSRLPASLRRRIATTEPPAGGLEQVKHVVLYMQENRSFDHYFGTLSGVRGFGDRSAIRTRATPSVFEQAHPTGGTVLPFSTREAAERQSQDLQYIESTPHGWDDGIGAWSRGWNDSWIANKGPATMCYLDRTDIPFQYEMADAFTICDAYHCSVPSSTSPNRNHFVSGYTGFEPGTETRAVTNAGYDDAHPGYEWRTYAELLEDAGVSWKVYHEWDDFEDNNLDLFEVFKDISSTVLAEVDGGPHTGIDTFYMSLFGRPDAEVDTLLGQLDAAVEKLPERERNLFDKGQRRSRPGTLAQSMADDIAAGTFPTVAYVVTTAADCEHASTSSPIQGAKVTYDVLDVLADDDETWNSTVFFYTFDENDGLFDHVPAPFPPADDTDEHEGDRPVGLGARVPMIVISPWTIGGWVCSETFDHTSMTQFLEIVTGVGTDQITPWRRRVAGDLTSAFDFTGSGGPATYTAVGEIPEFVERWLPEPPAEQAMPVQEEGTRPARPLPYQTDAFATLGEDGIEVTLTNNGTKSAAFAVYAWHDTTVTPVPVDLESGAEVTVPVGYPAVIYDISVTGPNRFLREFAGSGEPVNVSSAIDGDALTLTLTITNPGEDEAVDVTIAPLQYSDVAAESVTIEPAAASEHVWVADDADGWYDVEITLAGSDSFRRRLTGHIENGQPSTTG